MGSATGATAGSGSASGTTGGAGSPCAGAPLFCDDFENNALASAYTTYNGTWTRNVGSYLVTDATAWERARATIATGATDPNFDVTVVGQTSGDYGLGLLFGASAGANDGYAVLVHPAQFQSVYLKQLVPGEQDVELGSQPLQAGLAETLMTLRVKTVATSVTVWLNGTQVLAGTLPSAVSTGFLGLVLSDTNIPANGAATFTLFRVDSAGNNTTTSSTAGTTTGGNSSGTAANGNSTGKSASTAVGTTGGKETTGTTTSSSTSGGKSSSSTGGNSSSSSTSTGGLTYMVGYKLGDASGGAAQVQKWLGRVMDLVGTGVSTESYLTPGGFQTANGNYPLADAQFPLLSVWGEANNLNDLSVAASGGYDSIYTQMAQALAAYPNPLLAVRIAWEFNGNWYQWSQDAATAAQDKATYANYIAAFRRAAKIIRQYNPHVLVEWCVSWGQPNPMNYWPGAYDASSNPGGVDVISMDFYQGDVTTYNNGGNQSDWADLDSEANGDGLSWLVSTAQAEGVKIALSEYAAGSQRSNGFGTGAGLDDGAWVAASVDWINSLPPGLFLWTTWSDDAPADDLSSATANPAEAQVWLKAWGNTHFAGTWWPGTAPPKD